MTTSETALMYVSVPQSSPQFYRADILLGKAQSSSISMRFHKETKLDAPYNQCLKSPDDIDSDFVKAAINVRKTRNKLAIVPCSSLYAITELILIN